MVILLYDLIVTQTSKSVFGEAAKIMRPLIFKEGETAKISGLLILKKMCPTMHACYVVVKIFTFHEILCFIKRNDECKFNTIVVI
jgi:hypothetical protein